MELVFLEPLFAGRRVDSVEEALALVESARENSAADGHGEWTPRVVVDNSTSTP